MTDEGGPDQGASALDPATTALTTGLAASVVDALDQPIRDGVGLAVGDWLAEQRKRNLIRLKQRTRSVLDAAGVTDQRDVSPRLIEPLVRAAADETDETLQGLWARLIANALDPERPMIRRLYIETLKQFEPADARLLQHAAEIPGAATAVAELCEKLALSKDELDISSDHLESLGCTGKRTVHKKPELGYGYTLTALGTEIHRACYTTRPTPSQAQ